MPDGQLLWYDHKDSLEKGSRQRLLSTIKIKGPEGPFLINKRNRI